MTALAEDATARRLGGDTTISFEDLVRLDRCADLAVRRLGIKPGAKPVEDFQTMMFRLATPSEAGG